MTVTNPTAPTGGATGGSPEGFLDLKDQVRFVIIVLFIAFSVLLVTVIFGAGAWYATYAAQQQASYEALNKSVIEQNAKIDFMIAEYGAGTKR